MKTKYGLKEYLEEYRRALGEEPATTANNLSKPNILQLIRSKKELNNKGPQWPLV